MNSDLLNFIYSRNHPQKETEAMVLGKVVDVLLTENSFGSVYVVFDGATPVNQKQRDFCLDIFNEEPLENAYKNNYSIKKLSDKGITEKATELYEELKDYITTIGDTRIQISQELFNKATNMQIACLEHNMTKAFRGCNDYFKVEVYNQVELYWNCKITGLGLKGKPDEVVINRYLKIVYLIDFKTTEEAGTGFQKTVSKYNYCFQLAFYKKGLVESGWIESKGAKDYRIVQVLCAIQKSEPHSVTYYTIASNNYDQSVASVLVKLKGEIEDSGVDIRATNIKAIEQKEMLELY